MTLVSGEFVLLLSRCIVLNNREFDRIRGEGLGFWFLGQFRLHWGHMKKLLLSLGAVAVLLTGAGCSVPGASNSAGVEGKWNLAFDLPSGWTEVASYPTPNKVAVTPSTDVNHTMTTVVLQSTDKAIVRSGTPDAAVAVDSYVASNYTKIDVDRLDARRSIPKDAKDLGNGFFKAAAVAESDRSTYYFKTSTGEKYQFTVWVNGQDASVAESVILSSEPVTVFTDTVPPVSATGSDATTK